MPPDTPITLRIISLFGLIVFIAVAFAFSESRRKISWRLAASSLGLQFAFGLIVLHTEAGKAFFDLFKAGFDVMTDASAAASQFLFGNLSNFFLIDSVVAPGEGGALAPAKGYPISAVFAFRVLPLIVFVSGVAGILQHLGAIQAVVRGLSWLMRRTLKTSGAETFGVALQVFMGIESISAQSGYIKTMTRSELFTIMTSFLATIAASVMVAYANFGAEPGHLVAASLMSAPASILMAKLLVPELDRPLTLAAGGEEIQVESHNVFDAAAQGAALGVQIAINVGALLIVFVGLIYLMDQASLKVSGQALAHWMGYVFRPVAWLLGVPSGDLGPISQLIATKTVFNEFLAYQDLGAFVKDGALSERGRTLATYALCSFANPGSVGIMIAGIASLAPERRPEIAQLALKAFLAGTLVSLSTACVAGVIL